MSVLLEESTWKQKAKIHHDTLAPFAHEFRSWRMRGKKHPVYDFLFSYYSFSSGELLRWSPGLDIELISSKKENIPWKKFFKKNHHSYSIDPQLFPKHRVPFLKWSIQYLKNTSQKKPMFHCFGLHEWAMVYKEKDYRHTSEKLRLSNNTIDSVVENQTICCTHYDAFRFFTQKAQPLNKHQLKRTDVLNHDQPGCIHANMDLYRLCYKAAPFHCSELLSELFLLAKRAREIDMRASPYDLATYELDPIKIETKEGREEYILHQSNLAKEAQVLRMRLLASFENILEKVESTPALSQYTQNDQASPSHIA